MPVGGSSKKLNREGEKIKKFLIVLLSLGLILPFSTAVLAAAANFAGQYYARGPALIIGNPSLQQFELGRPTTANPYPKAKDFITPGLSFEQTWVEFATGIGNVNLGYRSGTPYSPATAPGVSISNKFGNVTMLAGFNKGLDKGLEKGLAGGMDNGTPNVTAMAVPKDSYDLGAKYKFKSGEAGLLWTHFQNTDKRTDAKAGNPGATKMRAIRPYIMTKLGAVDLEAEAYWMNGKAGFDAEAQKTNGDVKTRGVYVNGRYTMGPAYVGGAFLYASGDDAGPSGKGGSQYKTGYGVDPATWGEVSPAILFADAYGDSLDNAMRGNGDADSHSVMNNVWLYQLYGGFAAARKLDFNAKLTIAKADEKPAANYLSKDFGTELDVKATYKVVDKLSYNVGAAYLWAGDYFKGPSTASKAVANNYYLSYWIDLRF